MLEQARVVSEVPEAPVFRPTAREFQDPLEYIASIHAVVAPYGIAKIVPTARSASFKRRCTTVAVTPCARGHAYAWILSGVTNHCVMRVVDKPHDRLQAGRTHS